MHPVSRRDFLALSTAAVGLAATTAINNTSASDAAPLQLSASRRTLDIAGKAVSKFALLDARGRPGLVLDPGQRFRVDLANTLDRPTLIHWHGQIPPNAQDGAPNSNPLLAAGSRRSFDFVPNPGTHWMHAHVPDQEIDLLAAPLIVRRDGDLTADRQEVVLLLNDLSFRAGDELLAELSQGRAMDHSASGGTAMYHSAMGGMAMDHNALGGMAMDLNDVAFDAYLANHRTLDDPEIVAVDAGTKVLLRVINAATMTAFWLDTGALPGRLLAVDGQDIVPLEGQRFGLAMGQRLDVELQLPSQPGSWPILALREGGRERTGLILATTEAAVARLGMLSDAVHPAFSGDLRQERALRALHPLPPRPTDRQVMVMLSGGMQPYAWAIDGQPWGTHSPIAVRTGERVEMMFHNMTMMAHPMHLHGHHFQVTAINQQGFAGAVRDTVHVPAMGSVTIAFDAGEVADWILHCHHIGHMATGMMTELRVQPA